MRYGPEDVTAITCAFGKFWDLFSDQYFATTQAANPRPAKFVLITDVPRDVPAWIEAHAIGEGRHLYEYFSAAIPYVETEWLWGHGFDDLMEPDAFSGFDSDADCHGFPEHMLGGVVRYGDCETAYETMYLGGPNPMLGSYLHRTALMRQMPWRAHDFGDWSHFSEMAWFKKSIDFDSRCIATWTRSEHSSSLQWNPEGIEQIWRFQDALRSGRVPAEGAPEVL